MMLILQEFCFDVKDRQGLENQVAVQLSKSGAARKEHSFIPALEFVLTFKFVYMPF